MLSIVIFSSRIDAANRRTGMPSIISSIHQSSTVIVSIPNPMPAILLTGRIPTSVLASLGDPSATWISSAPTASM
jgi:hypothetical protein